MGNWEPTQEDDFQEMVGKAADLRLGSGKGEEGVPAWVSLCGRDL